MSKRNRTRNQTPSQPSPLPNPAAIEPMSDRPNYLVIVAHAGQLGMRIASAHATEADANGMIDMLSSLVSPGSAVYLLPMPGDNGIIGSVIEPVNAPVAAEKAPAPLPVTQPEPVAPAKPPVPFRRVSQEQFIEETMNMVNGTGDGMLQWRDADAPLREGGAIG